jgi:4-hydroxy-tetrahydrodipicolinate synthase
MPPYYFHAEESDVLKYFRQLASRSTLPMLLYNLPRIGGDVFTPEILSQLARCEMISGYKDSSGNSSMLRALALEHRSEEFAVFEGLATRTLQSLTDGLTGVFSGMANILPELDAAIRDSFLDGNQPLAARLQTALERLVAAVNQANWPVGIGVKRALWQMGFSGSETLCPIRGWDDYRMEDVEAALGEARALMKS